MSAKIVVKFLTISLASLFVVACGSPAPTIPQDDLVQTAMVEIAINAEHTEIAASTLTSQALPSNTPRPTNTSIPTPTATPIPLPQIIEGSGDDVVNLDDDFKGEFAFIHVEYTGGSNLIIWGLDRSGEEEDLLVNTIGSYDGYRLLNLFDSDDIQRISVESSGNWIITVFPMDIEYIEAELEFVDFPRQVIGNGDYIFFVTTEIDTIHAEANGEGNFVVWSYGIAGTDLLFNEIAPYSGRVIFPRGSSNFIDVQAEGEWILDFEN